MNTLKEIVPEIIEWANAKGILNNSEVTQLDQMRKTQEEMGELWVEIIRDDRPRIINEIGDVFVTLVIQCEMRGTPPVYELPNALTLDLIGRHSATVAMGDLGASITKLWQAIGHHGWDKSIVPIDLAIYDAIYHLNSVAAVYGISLEDCAYHALKKIQNRTGEIINGQFVKDQ